MPTGRITAPFTPRQVERLDAWQKNPTYHPFTCPNRGDGSHHVTTDLGVLVATGDGWVCRDCDYTQEWAHAFMAGTNHG